MSRVEGKISRVEGKMSRVQKCRLYSGNESLVKKPEFLSRFCIIEQFIYAGHGLEWTKMPGSRKFVSAYPPA